MAESLSLRSARWSGVRSAPGCVLGGLERFALDEGGGIVDAQRRKETNRRIHRETRPAYCPLPALDALPVGRRMSNS